MRAVRVYVDTCVFGGAFDREFQAATQRFIDEVRCGGFHLVVSALVQAELTEAPPQVSDLFAEMLEWTAETVFSALFRFANSTA